MPLLIHPSSARSTPALPSSRSKGWQNQLPARNRAPIPPDIVDAMAQDAAAKPSATCGSTASTPAAGPYPSWEATPEPTPAPKKDCGPCTLYGPCAFAKRGCLAGEDCAFCHDRAHLRTRECKPLRDASCRLCRAKGPCPAFRGTCAQGNDCGFCHVHALAPGRSTEFQRAVRRHQKFQHQDQQKASATLAAARARPSYLDPTTCSCLQCGPCRREAWLSKPRYRSQSPKCHSCTVFCDCSCDEPLAIAPAEHGEPAMTPAPLREGSPGPKRQARRQRQRCWARWQGREEREDHAAESRAFYSRASGSADTPAIQATDGRTLPAMLTYEAKSQATRNTLCRPESARALLALEALEAANGVVPQPAAAPVQAAPSMPSWRSWT